MAREDLSDKVTLEKKPEGNEGKNQVSMWKKSVPGRGHSKCKGSEAGVGASWGKSHLQPVE